LADRGAGRVYSTEDGDDAVVLLGEEDVSVGGGEEITGAAEAGDVESDFEAGWDDGYLTRLAGDCGGIICNVGGGVWGGEIGGAEGSADAGLLEGEVGEGRRSGERCCGAAKWDGCGGIAAGEVECPAGWCGA
jgi:hypothetical protein